MDSIKFKREVENARVDWQLVNGSLFSHAIMDYEEVLLVTVHH